MTLPELKAALRDRFPADAKKLSSDGLIFHFLGIKGRMWRRYEHGTWPLPAPQVRVALFKMAEWWPEQQPFLLEPDGVGHVLIQQGRPFPFPLNQNPPRP